MDIGAKLVLKTVNAISEGTYNEVEQQEFIKPDETLMHAPKIFKDDCRINWNKPIAVIHNFIRGLSPHPGAFTEFISPAGKSYTVKLFATTKELCSPLSNSTNISTDSKTFLKIAGHQCP